MAIGLHGARNRDFEPRAEDVALNFEPETLRKVVDAFSSHYGQPSAGFAVSVSHHGELKWSHATGMANMELEVPLHPGSVFHVASVSKQFTAVAIAMLIQDGLLSLEDDVRTHIPELREYGKAIRLHHLIHHTSGLRDDLWVQDFAGWRDDAWVSATDSLDLIFRQQGLSFPTGTAFSYTNAGYSLLALIVERVGGATLSQFVQERIFVPLGMDSTRFAHRPGEIIPNRATGYGRTPEGEMRILSPEVGMNGAIGLYTTVEDFSQWFGFLDDQVANNTVIGRLILQNGELDNGDSIDYSLGFFTGNHYAHPIIRHGGSHGGFRSHMLYFPSEQLGISCFGNWSELNPGAICDAVADAVLGFATEASNPDSESLSSPDFNLSAGVWFEESWGAWLLVLEKDDELWLMDTVPRAFVKENSGGYSANKPGIGAVIHTADGQDTSTLNVYVGATDEPDVFRRLEFPAPTVAELQQFHGDYWSDELNALYTILPGSDDHTLLLTRRGHEPAVIYPAGSDSFVHGFFVNQISLVFTRDAGAKINGFALSSLRTRNIAFQRMIPK